MDSLAGSVALADPLSVDVGFQPVFLIGALTSVADSDSAAGLDLTTAYFVSDGTTTLCVAARDTHGAGTMQTARGWSDKVSFVSNSGSLVINGTLTFDSTGFDIDFDAAVGTRALHYLAVGGAEITAKVVEWDKAGTTGTLDVTSAGFGSPDGAVFLTAHTVSAAPAGLDGDVLHSLGFAKNGGAAHCIGNAHDDNVSNSDTNRSQQSNSVLFHRLGVGGSTALDVQVDSWITDGVRLNFVTNVTSGINGGALFIKGATLNVYGITTDVDGSAHTQQFTGLPARADVGMLISAGDNGFTNEQTHAITSIGFWDQGLNNAGAGWFAEHASGDSDTRQGGSGNNALYLIHSTVSPYIVEMGEVSAVGDTTLDITYPDAALKSTSARQLSVLSFTDSAATVEPTGIATTTAMGAPTLEAGATAEPATIATATTMDAVTVLTITYAVADTIATVTTMGAPALETGSEVSVATIATVTVLDAPTVLAGNNALVEPATIATATTMGPAVLETGATLTPVTVATVSTVGAMTLQTGATPTPATISTNSSVSGPVVVTVNLYRQKKTNTTTSTSVSVTLDQTPVVGNVLVLVAAVSNTNALTLPTGWNTVWGFPLTASTTIGMVMAWKVVAASEPTTIAVSGSGSVARELAVYEFEDMSFIDGAAVNTTTSGTSLSTNSAPLTDGTTGVAIAALAVSVSGGTSTQNNAWSNGFTRDTILLSRTTIAMKPITTRSIETTTESWGAARAAVAGMLVLTDHVPTAAADEDRLHEKILETEPLIYVPFDSPVSGNPLMQEDLATVGGAMTGTDAPINHGTNGFNEVAPLDGATDHWVMNATSLSKLKTAVNGATEFSVGIWFSQEARTPTGSDYLLRLWQYGFGISMQTASGQLSGFFYDSAGTIRSVTGTVLSNTPERGGGMQFVVMTYNGTELLLYRNGIRTAGTVLTGQVVRADSNTTTLTLGRDGGGTDYWPGTLSQFMVWDRPLAQEQVLELYHLGHGVPDETDMFLKRTPAKRARHDKIYLNAVTEVVEDRTPHVEFVHSVSDTRATSIPYGALGVVDGQLVYQEIGNTARTWLVERTGDDFTLGASPISTASSIGQGVGSAVFFDDRVTVRTHNGTTDNVLNVFVDGDLDTATPTTPTNPFSTRTPDNSQANVSSEPRMQQGTVRLDGTHMATYGTWGSLGGYRPFIFLAEWAGATPSWTSYGPFTFGDKSSVAGIKGGSISMVKLDSHRLLAVWQDTSALDFSGRPGDYLASSLPLYAQVLDFDLTAHTVTPRGPVYTLEGAGESYFHLEWLPDINIAVLFSFAWDSTVNPFVEDYKITAKSFKVDGEVVTGCTERLDVASMKISEFNPGDFFYEYGVVGVDNVFMVVYSDVDDFGGNIRYAKVLVQNEGPWIGALGVVEDDWLIEGVLSPDDTSYTGDYELSTASVGGDIGNGEKLLMFEREVDGYTQNEINFILARRTP